MTITHWKLIKGSAGKFMIKIDDDDFIIRKVQNNGQYIYMRLPHSILGEIYNEIREFESRNGILTERTRKLI
ncbi:hypothetical protein LCGC14_0531550 [marine sediment metagenome]|uniref:Uncharacterized protein n=1 Tax=marine sediment metagenome TaxID=412755 RepID=A0A0F9S0A6_9ZZZZ